MAAQVTAIMLLILAQDGQRELLLLGQIALWVVLIAALASAVDYYRAYQATPADVTDFEEARRQRRTG
jgi:uncharacterized membrane protein